MRRTTCSAVVIALLLAAVPVAADPGREQNSQRSDQSSRSVQTGRSSTTKRVLWTVVGAGAGFAAGVFIGLNKFDDALYSDRKVWTSAIVGAAAGGVAGALLSRTIGRSVPVTRAVNPAPAGTARPIDVSWADALHGPPAPAPTR